MQQKTQNAGAIRDHGQTRTGILRNRLQGLQNQQIGQNLCHQMRQQAKGKPDPIIPKMTITPKKHPHTPTNPTI